MFCHYVDLEWLYEYLVNDIYGNHHFKYNRCNHHLLQIKKRRRCHLGMVADFKPAAGGGFHHLSLYREKDVKRKHL